MRFVTILACVLILAACAAEIEKAPPIGERIEGTSGNYGYAVYGHIQ